MAHPDELAERGWRFETYEERLAFSAQPVADVWQELAAESIVEPSSAMVQPLGSSAQATPLTEGHGWTDLATARAQYGLRGDGQTVAIIDSGIAYDHVALGGGLGNGYKVVGGWDFAENDANPYDDGPAGFHGTHVSGIVAASDKRYGGVAPGVELVGLRVFDDAGNGNLTWVSQALAWVHQHKNDFEFPITTVNLSLGALWNSSTLPEWATLESGLKQLADDGIFTAVAAGNSFLSFNAPGLSYPAASPSVTPVASVDASGNLSRFSQRDSSVLAAPGERIMSTLPDAFYGNDGVKNDWGAASGTSMAAPYVAGVSVLLRDAWQKLGSAQVQQTTISNLLHQTADRVYDSLTGASYDRVNVGRALATLVGPDDFGSSAAEARSLGELATTLQVSGTIGSTTDQDFFRFTASHSGTATLTLVGSAQAGATWVAAADGQRSGDKLTLAVQAGQSYVVGVAGGGSIGKFSVDLQLVPQTPPAPVAPPARSIVDWGVVTQATKNDVPIAGDGWFKVTATHTGQLTVESFAGGQSGNVRLEVFDGQERLVAKSAAGSGPRIDVPVAAGDTLLIHAFGANRDVDFRLTNLVTLSGQLASVRGTAGNDAIRWQADTQQILVNGASYSLRGITNITIDSGAGIDTLTLVGGTAAESLVLRPKSAELTASGYQVFAAGAECIQFRGDKLDRATLYDSAAGDLLETTREWTRLSGSIYSNYVTGVGTVAAVSRLGGADFVRSLGGGTSHVLSVWTGTRTMYADGVQTSAASGPPTTVSSLVEQVFAQQADDLDSCLARQRLTHKRQADLAALEHVFQEAGRQ